MIDSHQKFRIPDENKVRDLVLEVNWNPKDKKTNQSKVIRVIYPDGSEAKIRREHLNAMLFALGNPEEQMKMIPQKVERVHWIRTTLGVKATKDIKKGEAINFPIEISAPCSLAQEILGDVDKSRLSKY